ncbi:MAG: LPS export ABC transporter permease LptG [Gammaproteobacteria bacterium]|nr:LPS export ABC transporter permease LptG [Gammaproteobacteria bacterium]
MRILDLYIGRTLLYQTVVVLAVLLGLFTFVSFIDQLTDLGVNDFGLWDIVKFLVLSAPRLIYELFPTAALLGAMLGLSILASDSELIVMRTSGISLYRIILSVLKVGGILLVIAVLVGELLMPTAETMAQRGRAEALQRNIRQQTDFGLWMRDRQTYVNVGEVLPDLTLLRVRIFEFDDDGRLRSLVYAREGDYEDGGWRLEEVSQTLIEQGGAASQKADSATWRTVVDPEILAVFLINADQLSLWQLKNYIRHLRENHQETGTFELAFWSKVALPLATGLMVILAIPFVFSNIRSGVLGKNLLIGIMLGLGFYAANKGFGYFVLLYHITPSIGAFLPILAFAGLAVVMIRRAA